MKSEIVMAIAVSMIVFATPVAADSAAASGETTMSMQRMREHMQAMKATLQKARDARDEKEKRRLLNEHMQAMMQGMRMMDHMAMSEMPMGQMQDMHDDGRSMQHQMHRASPEDGTPCSGGATSMSEHPAMQKQMRMMQMMMRQMLEHQAMQQQMMSRMSGED